jgi:enterochelin esterase-like enzyme
VGVFLSAIGFTPTGQAAASPAPPALPGFSVLTANAGEGSVLTGVIPSSTAPQPLRASFVYLPPGFDPSVRYPVVYLLHGMPGGPGEYVDALELRNVADTLIAAEAQPFIAVVPAAGPTGHYNGEWAGPWEQYVVADVVPWTDRSLPTLATPAGRTIAGLSAGGFGAADIGLRAPEVFGQIEGWSAYYHPLRDGPFKQADRTEIVANDPFKIAGRRARQLRLLGTRFFLSTGPNHSHWFTAQQTIDFAQELRRLKLPVTMSLLPSKRLMYATQLRSGLAWAFGRQRGA